MKYVDDLKKSCYVKKKILESTKNLGVSREILQVEVLVFQDKVLVHIHLLRQLGIAKRADVNFRRKFVPFFVSIIGEIALIISAPS